MRNLMQLELYVTFSVYETSLRKVNVFRMFAIYNDNVLCKDNDSLVKDLTISKYIHSISYK